MTLSASVTTVLNDLAQMDDVAIRDLYKQMKAAWLVAHANGLAVVTWTLPTGVSRSISTTDALAALRTLQELMAADEGSFIAQPAELP
jgi:hypothetical protein